MIEQMNDLPPGVLGFTTRGQVTATDVETVLVPIVEAGFALNHKLRLISHVASDFSGFDAGALWDDIKLSMRHLGGWDRVAVVTDVGWVRTMAQAFGFTVPAEFQLFADGELLRAKQWIVEPPLPSDE